jgi:hypothetical protein
MLGHELGASQVQQQLTHHTVADAAVCNCALPAVCVLCERKEQTYFVRLTLLASVLHLLFVCCAVPAEPR